MSEFKGLTQKQDTLMFDCQPLSIPGVDSPIKPTVQEAVQRSLSRASQRKYICVNELPTKGENATYLIYDAANDVYKQYVYFDDMDCWSEAGGLRGKTLRRFLGIVDAERSEEE